MNASETFVVHVSVDVRDESRGGVEVLDEHRHRQVDELGADRGADAYAAVANLWPIVNCMPPAEPNVTGLPNGAAPTAATPSPSITLIASCTCAGNGARGAALTNAMPLPLLNVSVGDAIAGARDRGVDRRRRQAGVVQLPAGLV